jgi:hypothetical protein
LDQICRHSSFGVGGEGQDVGPSLLEMVGHRGQFVGERVDDPVERGVHRGGVGLVIDRVQVPADDLDTVMAGLTASPNVDGILVTMPHKVHCLGPLRHQF